MTRDPRSLFHQRICGRLLVGQGSDTYDPLCALPAGHDGLCKPENGSDQMSEPARSDSEHHRVTGTLTYSVVKCGRCPKTWEQLRLVGDRSGEWSVCPHCGWPAPMDMEGGPV